MPLNADDGDRTVSALGPFSSPASATFTIVPTLALSHNVGQEATPLTASGIGFTAGETVTVTYNATDVATTTASNEGNWSATFDVPVGGPASSTVAASTPSTPAGDIPEENFYINIQAAIDAATTGALSIASHQGAQVILVGPGLYNETLNINTPGLIIQSVAGPKETFVFFSGAAITTVTVGPNADGLLLGSPGFSIEPAANGSSTIEVQGGAERVTIENNVIHVAANGSGLHVGDGTVIDLAVLRSFFQMPDTSTASALFASDGLTVGLLIEGSIVNGGGGQDSVGFDLLGVQNVMVQSNEVFDVGTAIRLRGDGAGGVNTHTVRIDGSFFASTGGLGAQIEVYDSYGGAASTSGVDISGNELSGGANHGVSIDSRVAGGLVSGVRVQDNDLVKNVGTGVQVGPAAPGGDISQIRVNFNNIISNDGLGVANTATSSLAVDARWNWWGDFTGPSGGPEGGSGDEISEGVRYSGWLALPRSELSSPMEWRVDTSDNGFGPSIQNTVDVARQGDSIIVHPERVGVDATDDPDLLSTANDPDPDGDDEAENAFAGADRDADGVSDYQFFQRDDGTMGQPRRTDEPLGVRVRAWVDGVSRVLIQDNQLWWFHMGADPPGLHPPGTIQPTFVNGVPWDPSWPFVAGQGRDCFCESSRFDPGPGGFRAGWEPPSGRVLRGAGLPRGLHRGEALRG